MSENLVPFDEPEELLPVALSEIPVASVVLTVSPSTLEPGTNAMLTVVVHGVGGIPLPDRTVTFASSNDTVIADPVSQTTSNGVASVYAPALAAGTTTITATCEEFTAPGITVTVQAVATSPGYDAIGAERIVITAEPMLIRMSRPKPRRFSDADQRRRDPTDSSFSRVKHNVEKEIVWPNRELMKRYL